MAVLPRRQDTLITPIPSVTPKGLLSREAVMRLDGAGGKKKKRSPFIFIVAAAAACF